MLIPTAIEQVVGRSESFAQIRYQTAAGANPGGTNTQDAWTKYPVATEVVDDDEILSLSSSVITLAAGDYEISGTAVLYNVGDCQLRLRNTTSNTTLVVGIHTFNKSATPGAAGNPTIQGWFTVAESQNLEIQYYCLDLQSTNGLGVGGVDTTEVNVFGDFVFRKL